jgi:hypothetical protein
MWLLFAAPGLLCALLSAALSTPVLRWQTGDESPPLTKK